MGHSLPLIGHLCASTPQALESFELTLLNGSSNSKKTLPALAEYFQDERKTRLAKQIFQHQNVPKSACKSRQVQSEHRLASQGKVLPFSPLFTYLHLAADASTPPAPRDTSQVCNAELRSPSS